MAGPLCRYEIERRPFGKSSTRLEVAVATELRSPHCLRIFTSNVAGVSAQQGMLHDLVISVTFCGLCSHNNDSNYWHVPVWYCHNGFVSSNTIYG